eukprot:635820-Prymnesium_polylepis.1
MLPGNTVTIRRNSAIRHATHHTLPTGRRELLIRTERSPTVRSTAAWTIDYASAPPRSTHKLLHGGPSAFRALPSRADLRARPCRSSAPAGRSEIDL